MPDQETVEKKVLPEVREFSDRLMVILGEALMEEIEKAEGAGGNMIALQFGALDALTKQLSGALTACVTMVRRLHLSQRDFVIFRQRMHEQLEPAVLALMNREIGRASEKEDSPYGGKKAGHA